MSTKTKKLPFAGKLAIIFVVLAVAFLILSIVSANYSVNRTIDAINEIGDVEYSNTSKEKIDLALSYYNSLDAGIGLPDKITNIEQLNTAKLEYVRLGIKKAYLADKNGEAEESIKQYVADARSSFDEYCTNGDCTSISNYEDLIALEQKYASEAETPNNSSPSDNNTEEEEIELC